MSDVFLSYKSEDRSRLAPLVSALAAEGIDVWWDQHIAGGANWRRDIEAHLEAARCVIVAWSALSTGPGGEFVRDEAGQAREAGHFLPIKIDDVRPPLGFRETQAISLVGWKGKRDDPRFQHLLATIRAMLAGEDIAGLRRPATAHAPKLTRRAAMVGTGAGVAILAAGGAGYLFLRGDKAQAATRIAVLPFANLSGDASQDYFSEGLSEELRGALSRAGLQVIGRTSSQAVMNDDTAQIVAKLKVSHILTGSVRKSPNQIRVSAQLVDGKDGVEDWSQNYDRAPGETIALQTDIATHVAQTLKLKLGPVLEKAIELGGTTDPVAQDLYYQVRAIFSTSGLTRDTYAKAVALFEHALGRDPKFAKAWIGLGQMHIDFAGTFASSPQDATQLLDQGEDEIRKGVAIAPTLGYGIAALANASSLRLKLRDCLEESRRAISVAPSDAAVRLLVDNILPYLATPEESMDNADRLIELEPLNPNAHVAKSDSLWLAGRNEEALTAVRRALEINPDHSNAIQAEAYVLAAMGRQDEAIALLEKSEALDVYAKVFRAIRDFHAGDMAGSDRNLAAIRADYGDQASYQYAEIYAQTGRIDQAFDALETGLKVMDPGLIATMRNPQLRPLHDDPRFVPFLKKLDYPIIDPGFGGGERPG